MTTTEKNRIKAEQIEMFKHQSARDIPNRKLKIMATDILKGTIAELKRNDFAILKLPIGFKVFSNEGLMFEALRMNSDVYSVLFDNSYFDGTVK